MKILLATHNPAKIMDYRRLLSENGINIETLNSYGIEDKYEEKFDSFEANALAKAHFYYNLVKMPTIAEDGGFEIDYFKGEPGVKSRRWPGFEATDKQIIDFLKKKIASIPPEQRTAKFSAACCLVKAKDEFYCVKNSLEGYLTEEYNDNYPDGFPYRAFFIEKTFNKYLMDLTEEEYDQINHRRKNIEEIVKYL